MKFGKFCFSMVCLSVMAFCMSILIACESPSSGCNPATNIPDKLISPQQVPSTENGALAADNRFFFIGGDSVYELLPQEDGDYDYRAILQRDDCIFGGLTADGMELYAACTAAERTVNMLGNTIVYPAWSELVRIDLNVSEDDPDRVAAAKISTKELFPNGMAVDNKGDIYITNTFAGTPRMMGLTPDEAPAIVRVRITDENLFSVQVDALLHSRDGGSSPNGLQIRQDRLWFTSGNVLYEARIVDSGLSNLKQIHSAASSRMFDDFAVLPDDTLVICEIPSPLSIASSGPPQLRYVSAQTGEVVSEYVLDKSLRPSSATFITDAQGEALYITDYYNGGIYRLGN